MWTLLLLLAATPLEQAQVLEERGDDGAAVKLLEGAVRGDPRWAMGRIELGRLQLKAGQTESAFHHLDIARTLAPENPRAHYLYALAADENGHRNECRHALEVALRLREGYADAQQRLAGVLFSEGEYALAARTLQPWVDAHPEANGARLQLAEALERAGDRTGAERELRALLRVAPLKVLAGRRLVALLEGQGRHAEASKLREGLDPPKRSLRELQPSKR